MECLLRPRLLALAVASTAALDCNAAGFALMEQNASGLGNAYAGAAAVAEDASTVWWNPAGMALLPAGRQVVFSAAQIVPSTTFHNAGSVAASGQALNGEGGDAGKAAFVPAGYFVMDAAPKTKFGLAVNVPFGLSTRYDATWMGRFQGIESEVKTLNINPSLAWAVDDRFSLGFGLNWQTGTIDLLTAANYTGAWNAVTAAGGAPALAALVPAGTEGQSRVSLSGDAWGYNAGALWRLNEATRLGVAYRSSVKYRMTGSTSFTGRPSLAGLPAAGAALGAAFNGLTADGPVSFTFRTPDSLAVSASHTLDSRWQLLADATWTGWGKVKSIPLVRDTGTTLDTLAFNFHDTLRLSVGANYRLDDGWILRAGFALDKSPVPSAESRSVRLPDHDRQWFTVGVQYRTSRTSAIDVGYAHLAVKNAAMNNNQNPPAGVKGLVNGTYDASVDILGAQFTYSF